MLLFIIKEPAINVSENQQHHLNEKHQEEIYELMSGIVTEEIFETEKIKEEIENEMRLISSEVFDEDDKENLQFLLKKLKSTR